MARSDYLDPRWQKFRLERLEIAGWKCEACGSTEETLHVHHPFYVSGRKPWEYLPQCTSVFCEECHSIKHERDTDYLEFGPNQWEISAGFRIQQDTPSTGWDLERLHDWTADELRSFDKLHEES